MSFWWVSNFFVFEFWILVLCCWCKLFDIFLVFWMKFLGNLSVLVRFMLYWILELMVFDVVLYSMIVWGRFCVVLVLVVVRCKFSIFGWLFRICVSLMKCVVNYICVLFWMRVLDIVMVIVSLFFVLVFWFSLLIIVRLFLLILWRMNVILCILIENVDIFVLILLFVDIFVKMVCIMGKDVYCVGMKELIWVIIWSKVMVWM